MGGAVGCGRELGTAVEPMRPAGQLPFVKGSEVATTHETHPSPCGVNALG